ncbi:hypothetical protein [Nocardia sp. NBC_01388]|uniref:hypothetical protein n=1 Tax=Nocardia sp. NBC_01388 TaxID=2903596 RepID=UPI00324D2BDD
MHTGHDVEFAAWFAQIFKDEAMQIVGRRLGAEVAERIKWGVSTAQDLVRMSLELKLELSDLLPRSLQELDGLGDELLRRGVEGVA